MGWKLSLFRCFITDQWVMRQLKRHVAFHMLSPDDDTKKATFQRRTMMKQTFAEG
jgi:hypothetical protein